MTRSRRGWARAGLPSAAAASEALPSAVPAPDPAPPAGPPRSSLLHVDCEQRATPSARQPKAKRNQMANGKRARVGSGTAKLVPAVPRDWANTKRTDATSMSWLCFARSLGLACQDRSKLNGQGGLGDGPRRDSSLLRGLPRRDDLPLVHQRRYRRHSHSRPILPRPTRPLRVQPATIRAHVLRLRRFT